MGTAQQLTPSGAALQTPLAKWLPWPAHHASSLCPGDPRAPNHLPGCTATLAYDLSRRRAWKTSQTSEQVNSSFFYFTREGSEVNLLYHFTHWPSLSVMWLNSGTDRTRGRGMRESMTKHCQRGLKNLSNYTSSPKTMLSWTIAVTQWFVKTLQGLGEDHSTIITLAACHHRPSASCQGTSRHHSN